VWEWGDEGLLWLYEAIFIVYLATAIPMVILERRRPTATLAWILIFAFLPAVGLPAYLLLGRRRVRRSRRAREQQRLRHIEATRAMANLERAPAFPDSRTLGLVRLALRTAAAPLRRSESVTLLSEPALAFETMSEAVANAKHRIHAEFYIWRDDETGRRAIELMAERAKSGCKVRLLIDDVGSFGTPDSHFKPLLDAGGEVERFGRLRVRFRRFHSRLDFRNHRKILTIDGSVGFTGGLNIGNEYSGAGSAEPAWNDLFVRIDGDATLSLEAIFLEDWQQTTGQTLDPMCDLPSDCAEVSIDRRPDTPASSEGPILQVIPSGPNLPIASVITAQFVAAIGIAQSRVWLVTPYFIPSSALALILRTAALRGVDVRILVPALEKNDSRIVAHAARSYYNDLLRAGCRIMEYQPRMLHAKYLLVDHCVATIGSANMDERSLHLMYEVTAMFYDQTVVDELAEVFLLDSADGEEVTLEARRDIGSMQRLAENSARLLAPLL
jgi:cardiolipin synthase